ncbi:hypothetical protein Lalb_Chr17g0335611 [Lupinus albus]|uniref:Uncharacterized protein n=1 Tax=Lupinus albus TaxID=3870 RepID=A0A6A4NSG2_LUPAL|nr:hypothetical protein Lalb_Chr17g0335611 [Lupinus albus]
MLSHGSTRFPNVPLNTLNEVARIGTVPVMPLPYDSSTGVLSTHNSHATPPTLDYSTHMDSGGGFTHMGPLKISFNLEENDIDVGISNDRNTRAGTKEKQPNRPIRGKHKPK